ncbi:DUF397 domain-containing protein [Kitasatospora sp. SC0581]
MAPGFPDVRPVRDSKDPNGPALIFAAKAWEPFATTLRSDEFGEV